MTTRDRDVLQQSRVFAWIAGTTGLVLLVPLVAMRFSSDMRWTAFDFAAAAVLLVAVGLAFVLAARRVHRDGRLAVALVALVALGYLWAELAVGVFTGLGS